MKNFRCKCVWYKAFNDRVVKDNSKNMIMKFTIFDQALFYFPDVLLEKSTANLEDMVEIAQRGQISQNEVGR